MVVMSDMLGHKALTKKSLICELCSVAAELDGNHLILVLNLNRKFVGYLGSEAGRHVSEPQTHMEIGGGMY